MALTDAERRVCEAIADRQEELVSLARALIAFDTTARNVGDPPRHEAALQEYLAEVLRDGGAEVDVWEPDGDAMQGKPLVPPGLDFVGRPQLIARRRAAAMVARCSSAATSTSSRPSLARRGRAIRSPPRSATASSTGAAPVT